MRIRLLFLFLLCTAAVLLLAQAPQNPPAPYLTVNFIKVPSARVDVYNEFVATMAKKVAQARIDMGDIVNWGHHQMVSPAGADAPYNFVSAVTWKDTPRLDTNPTAMDKFYAKAGFTRAAYMDKVQSIGATIVKREIWRMVERSGESMQPGDFIRIELKNVPSGSQFVERQRTVWKPVHEKRVAAGKMRAWGLYFIAQPGGEDRQISWAEVHVFKNEADFFASGNMREAFQAAHPGKSFDDIATDPKAKNVRVEIAQAKHMLGLRPATGSSGRP